MHPVAGDQADPAGDFSVTLDVTAGLLRVAGDLDLCSAPVLLEASRVLYGLAPGPMAIDLSGVTFCDAAGLNALVTLSLQHQERHEHLAIGGASPRLCRAFAAGCVSWLLDAAPDVLIARPHGV